MPTTYQEHQHEGPHIDDQEKQGDHGQSEDASDPPVLPSTEKSIKSGFNNMISNFWYVWFQPNSQNREFLLTVL